MILQLLERAAIFNMTMFMALTLGCIALYALSGYLRVAILAMRIPGPRAYPIIGNCFYAVDPNVLQKRAVAGAREYGGVTRIWMCVVPFFVVFDPEYLQHILGSTKHTDKSFFYKLMHNFLGNGLITSSGKQWSTHRKYIQPTFHMSILEKFLETFIDSAQCLHHKIGNAQTDVLKITNFVNDCVLDILNEVVLGVPIVSSAPKDVVDNSPFRQGKVVVSQRIANPWLLLNWIYKFTDLGTKEVQQKERLNEFTKQMIEIRRERMTNGQVPERKCLLDFMLEISDAHPDFTEDDIINEACTFMLAGQESVAGSIAFALSLLAQHQEHQQKCREEIDAIFRDEDRRPTMSDLKEMKYLEMCIKEAMRLYPTVPLIARKLGEDVQCGKYTLPAGSNVFIVPYATHRLPHIYPDPEKFVPERFSPENVEKRNPFAFLPFSAGPRICIGHRFALIEMKTIISTILRSYKLHQVPDKTEIDEIFRVTLRARGGLYVRFERRNK